MLPSFFYFITAHCIAPSFPHGMEHATHIHTSLCPKIVRLFHLGKWVLFWSQFFLVTQEKWRRARRASWQSWRKIKRRRNVHEKLRENGAVAMCYNHDVPPVHKHIHTLNVFFSVCVEKLSEMVAKKNESVRFTCRHAKVVRSSGEHVWAGKLRIPPVTDTILLCEAVRPNPTQDEMGHVHVF